MADKDKDRIEKPSVKTGFVRAGASLSGQSSMDYVIKNMQDIAAAQKAELLANPPKVVFGYSVFIDKVRLLIEQAEKLPTEERNAQSLVFREWLHSFAVLMERIRERGFPVNTQVIARAYADLYGGMKKGEAFERDLGLSLIELRSLVSQYDEFGPPSKSAKAIKEDAVAAPASPLATSVSDIPGVYADLEKRPLIQALGAASVQMWKFYGYSVFGAFLVGLAVAGWQPIHEVLLHWASDFTCLK